MSTDRKAIAKIVDPILKSAGLAANQVKAVWADLAVQDCDAPVITNRKGELEADPSLRDEENVSLPVDQALAYVIEVLPAFAHLHDLGLLYCDFKPDNIIQVGDEVKLIDLGGVRRVDDEDSAIFGTVGYQAPERNFAVGLGCDLGYADKLVYSRGLQLGDQGSAVPIGAGCKVCDRPACSQRAFPQLGRPVHIDETRSSHMPYPLDGH